MESWPDDRYDAESSPDVLLTDGADEVAIEINTEPFGERPGSQRIGRHLGIL